MLPARRPGRKTSIPFATLLRRRVNVCATGIHSAESFLFGDAPAFRGLANPDAHHPECSLALSRLRRPSLPRRSHSRSPLQGSANGSSSSGRGISLKRDRQKIGPHTQPYSTGKQPTAPSISSPFFKLRIGNRRLSRPSNPGTITTSAAYRRNSFRTPRCKPRIPPARALFGRGRSPAANQTVPHQS